MYVYVSNAASRDIHVLELNAMTGAVALVEVVAVPGTDQASAASLPMAVSPDHRFLYASLRGEPFPVSSFAIDPRTGRLTHLGTAPLPDHPVYLATDRRGKFLLVASYLGSAIAVCPIDGQGVVQAPAVQVLPSEAYAHSVLVDPGNRWLYAACCGADVVMQCRFDAATGQISAGAPPVVRTSAHARPRHIAFHPTRPLLYLLNEEAATINTYAISGDDGTLSELQSISLLPADFTGTPHCADLHLTPDGQYLYASERKASLLAGFRVDAASGTLSLLGHFPTQTEPRSFAIDPGGRFLLSAGIASHALSVHAIGSTGALSKILDHPLGQAPNWVEIIDLAQAGS